MGSTSYSDDDEMDHRPLLKPSTHHTTDDSDEEETVVLLEDGLDGSIQTSQSSSFLTAKTVEQVDVEEEVDITREPEGSTFNWKTFLSYCGPGFLMCIAYLDPGNLEADLQVGAYTNYSIIWVLFTATIMGFVLQCMSAKLGVVTGKHLARICREQYDPWTARILWILIEFAIIGSDLQEIIGSAIAFQILFNFPLWVGCLITFVDTFTFLGIHFFGVRKLEAIFMMLISIMTICFFINFFAAKVPASDVLQGFEPELHNYATNSAVGLIGAVIMPHNLFLHSALVLSRKINRRDSRAIKEANKYNAIDAGFALAVSFLINLSIVSVFAKQFFDKQCAELEDGPKACGTGPGTCNENPEEQCSEIGLTNAADALQGVFHGNMVRVVWGLGLLAAGQCATMTGTYSGQYVMEGFLELKIPIWLRVTITRMLAIGPGIVVALATSHNQHITDTISEYINISQSCILIFALIPVLNFTSSKAIMGQHVNSKIINIIIGVLSMLVFSINMYLVIDQTPNTSYTIPLLILGGILYFYFALRLFLNKERPTFKALFASFFKK